MSVDYKLIGSRIKQIRKNRARTQEWLAEQLDMTVGYVSQIECGVTKISLDTLGCVAGVLNIDIAFFVSGSAVENAEYIETYLFD